ncbi:stage V sporulation protein AB [Virgibacillus sp. YIM 98842]|jgi:stage V sporulation protein AB|uniref:stage V sporulation protein AB n=1 Tax=Virgibacillus sp. YIM 98842 TaxID=2663533 RepID=UPI0013D98C9B|nr:stage V sporulation protein AB [Virgibacillus sp. YIM 98842]
MIQTVINHFIQLLVGFSGGLAVGAGFVAFLTVLGIIPRLIQLSKTVKYINVYISSVIFGSLAGTFLSFTSVTWNQPILLLLLWGLLHGIFNGMLAAALTEVLNVFPILYKRLGIDRHLIWLFMAVVLGKIAGSLFQWLYFVK